MVMAIWLTALGWGYGLSLLRIRWVFLAMAVASAFALAVLTYLFADSSFVLSGASAGLILAGACCWRLLPRRGWRFEVGIWGVMLIGGAVIAVAGPQGATPSWLVLSAILGVAMLVGAPANKLCRTVLDTHYRSKVETDDKATQSADHSLRGGRLIGPLERWLLITLGLTGAIPVVVALVAAKGIVRFPEISADGAGLKAEEFLIGSFVSWGVALVGTLALATIL